MSRSSEPHDQEGPAGQRRARLARRRRAHPAYVRDAGGRPCAGPTSPGEASPGLDHGSETIALSSAPPIDRWRSSHQESRLSPKWSQSRSRNWHRQKQRVPLPAPTSRKTESDELIASPQSHFQCVENEICAESNPGPIVASLNSPTHTTVRIIAERSGDRSTDKCTKRSPNCNEVGRGRIWQRRRRNHAPTVGWPDAHLMRTM